MNANHIPDRIRRLALPLGLSGVAAIALLAGAGISTSVGAKPSPDKSAQAAQSALARGQVEKAISLAEAVVAGSPREPAYRALLGHAYLKAGRFESAATAFNDAMKLGDNSSRTALGLALANIAAGHNRDAVAILNDWRDAIPAADLGLALALAGESERGSAILADTLRRGENSVKIRQNLAYAYALDGRWREARLMMAQDVPADQIDRRISDWAKNAKPEDYKQRIAGLLNVPMRGDPGLPVALALNENPVAEQLAAESGAVKSLPQTASATTELPPADAQPASDLAQYAPVSASTASAPAYVAPVSRPISSESGEVVQPLPADYRRVEAAPMRVAVRAKASAKAPVAARPMRAAVAARAVPKGGSHAIQLGSFASQQGARRAWGHYAARNPELRNFRMKITPVVVRGKNFWRVAAAGFDARGASGMCSTVKTRGGVCFAYTMPRAAPQPGRPAVAAPAMAKAARPHSMPRTSARSAALALRQ